MGYITSGIGFDTDLWNEIERFRTKDGISRSQHIQTAIRRYHRQLKEQTVDDILDNLNDSEIDLLKKEIKKRS